MRGKRFVGELILTSGVLLSALFPACMQTVHNTDFRVCTGFVVNELLIETDDGHLWYYDNTLVRGSSIEVIFDTKGTKDVLDDEIITIKEF